MPLRIGELLVQRGVVSQAQVEAAVRARRGSGLPLASRLLVAGVDEGALAAVLAEKHGLPGVDLSRTVIGLETLDLVPRPVAEGDLILPLSLEGDRLHLAMARPFDERVISEVRFVTGREVSAYIALRGALDRAIAAAYDAHQRGEALWAGDAAAVSPEPGIAAFRPGLVPGDEPLELEFTTDAVLLPDEPPPEVPIEVGDPVPSRDRPLVLAVDDEPDIRRLVKRALEAKGYAVETAEDGEEALAKAEALLPDLVLLDAMLPKLHGFEACRRLKASARTRSVPVIMMTAIYRGWRFAQDARENYGAEDYVEKPFRLEDLLRRMEAVREVSAARNLERAGSPPAAPDPNVARGRELLAAGRPAEAAEALAAAAKADPRSPDVHFQLGRALRATGDAFGAMTALERALELRPGHLASLRALAAVYEEKGFRRKAAEVLERALPSAPDDTRAAIREDLLRLLG